MWVRGRVRSATIVADAGVGVAGATAAVNANPTKYAIKRRKAPLT